MYPRTIDDGIGSTITFLGVSDDDVLTMSGTVDPGAGPPMHVHRLQTETVTVVSGRIGVVLDDGAEQFYGPGDTAVFAPGVVHRFWNAGDEVAEITGSAYPAGNLEWFLTQVYAAGGRPRAFEGAFLSTRYRTEFAITEIPAPIRRYVLPTVAILGRLLGRYTRYKDAPHPVRRQTGATLPGRSTTSARSSAG